MYKMNKAIDVARIISKAIHSSSCFHCCQFYVQPETAPCGHTLCHSCWRTNKKCPYCFAIIDKAALRLNETLLNRTECMRVVTKQFEKVYKIKVEEILLDATETVNIVKQPNQHVVEWLEDSDNKFSQQCSNFEPSNKQILLTEVQVSCVSPHKKVNAVTNKNVQPKYNSAHQDDWDKIEVLPDSEDPCGIDKENVIGPMDVEPFSLDEEEFTNNVNARRRSSRKKDNITCNEKSKSNQVLPKDQESHNEKSHSDNNIQTKRAWSNVKKMKKEFSKLNKRKNIKSKLNVSIEKARNTQSLHSKSTTNAEPVVTCSTPYIIDENNTPAFGGDGDQFEPLQDLCTLKSVKKDNSQEISSNNNANENGNLVNQMKPSQEVNVQNNVLSLVNSDQQIKIPFLKVGKLVNKVETIDYESSKNVQKEKLTKNIEIIIKIGDEVTEIVIGNKDNSLKVVDFKTSEKSATNIEIDCSSQKPELDRSISLKKNTASAETVTAPYEITESVEKEMFSKMELTNKELLNRAKKVEIEKTEFDMNVNSQNNSRSVNKKTLENELIMSIDDLDIFTADSTKGRCDQINSEILETTVKENCVKICDKRPRDINDSTYVPTKRMKDSHTQKEITCSNSNTKEDSQRMDYDEIMDRVFANIDSDLNNDKPKNSAASDNFDNKSRIAKIHTSQGLKYCDKIDSENLFSAIGCTSSEKQDKISNPRDVDQGTVNVNTNSQNGKDDSDKLKKVDDEAVFVTPDIICNTLDDSEVVEATPQKESSKGNDKSGTCDLTDVQIISQSLQKENLLKKHHISSQELRNDVNPTEVNDKMQERGLETPSTIYTFANQILYESTPLSRKSSKFLNSNKIDDKSMKSLNMTIVNTSQEKQFMLKAFENSPSEMCARSLNKLYVACSCLTPIEVANVKELCSRRNWTYLDKYSAQLTHLIVATDKNNKSQRSVKYMCALAAGKWILSYKWVSTCLRQRSLVDECDYEVLDSTGDQGPRLSRIAKGKLFEGFTFFCMPPFTVLNQETLEDMLISAGGYVTRNINAMNVSKNTQPAILLAESESTQDDRFIDLAVRHGVIPVNYEWSLNCLGVYSLLTIMDLLLCPASLLSLSGLRWPPEILAPVDDD